MTATFQNSATVLSIGIFFTLIILGLAATLPSALSYGLTAQGVPPPAPPGSPACPRCRYCSPRCLAITRQHSARPGSSPSIRRPRRLPDRTRLLPLGYRPGFGDSLAAAFDFAIAACLVAAVVSLLRGRTHAYGDPPARPGPLRRKPPAAARKVLTAADSRPALPGQGRHLTQAWINPAHSRLHAQHHPVDYNRTVPHHPSLACCHAGPYRRSRRRSLARTL
jgi:hypothetical protein